MALAVAIGALHLLVAPGRSHDWAWEGAGLAGIGVVQVALGCAALWGGRRTLAILIVALVLPIVGLVFTRTAGYPFGPYDGFAPSMTGFEFVVITISVITISLIGGTLLAGPDLLGPPGPRFDTLSALAVVAAAIPGIAVSTWLDDASHLAGSQHVHSASPTSSTLSTAERAELGAQLVDARDAALALPTLGRALDAGWVKVGPVARGIGRMVVAPRSESTAPIGIDSPFALLYASDDTDAPVVGMQYTLWSTNEAPTDFFTGQKNMWHLHPTACAFSVDGREVVVPVDEPLTGRNCQLVNGRVTDDSSFMLRVWVVAGWENPAGTFAHEHPEL